MRGRGRGGVQWGKVGEGEECSIRVWEWRRVTYDKEKERMGK